MTSRANVFASLPANEKSKLLEALDPEERVQLVHQWDFWARPSQREPDGGWNTWLILAGRGAGKTRTGSEWIRKNVCGSTPLEAGKYKRIALVAETAADARDVLVEGESGLLAVHPTPFRPLFEPSKRRLTWPNGAVATLYNATEPDQLRGPQHDASWLDELCLAAGTQIAAQCGEVAIENVKAGDEVLTRAGWRKVLYAWQSSYGADVYRLETKNGRELVGTADHPVFLPVSLGFLPLRLLKPDNVLVSVPDETGKFTEDSVLKVEKLSQKMAVYNLEVEGEHEYFANGILTHNCKFKYLEDTYNMLMFGLRLGTKPRKLITTTPRPLRILRDLMDDPTTYVTRGSTLDNSDNLPPSFLKTVYERYAGTRLGRQELEGEILDDVPGALWSRRVFDQHRIKKWSDLPAMKRVLVSIDPAAKASTDTDDTAETGITIGGLGTDGRGYLFDDVSCREGPAGWARLAVAAYDRFEADAIVAEVNQGGQMVEQVIHQVRPEVKIITVHASRGKVTRAEPISALYEQGRISHLGSLPILEDQMILVTPFGVSGGGLMDRVDSVVWLFTELMLQGQGVIKMPKQLRRHMPTLVGRSRFTGY